MAHFELPGIRFFIGIDPGMQGGIAVLSDTDIWGLWPLTDQTDADIANILTLHGAKLFAMIENVHAFPKMNASSSFKLGTSFGVLRGCLAVRNIPREFVTPAKWQKALGCLSHGDKNITKRKAQELFPGQTITHITADALLIAEYCRRTIHQREKLKEAA